MDAGKSLPASHSIFLSAFHPTVAFLRDAILIFISFVLYFIMRFLLLVLPFLAAVSALPLSQPVVRVSAKYAASPPHSSFTHMSRRPTLRSLIHRPEIGTILRRIPELDVSQVISELNASCHGALPTLPPSVVPQIQRAYDIAHGGAEFVGNHPVIADFVAKVAGFNWGGGHGEKDAGLGGGIGSIGDYELPTWLMELIEELIKLFDGRSGGQVRAVCLF